ncbi:MAG: ATP-binding cassette domain-containing protein [Propionibacteriaceae bacterium]|jgi:iron complex transport system ATP-binding protein|nr:ATP-binding cassette domain-containing protein [Propionibacteriaceae bacterium]
MASSFRTERLAVGYHGKPLVRDIVLDLPEGTVLSLIGPNGAGKSTILKTIAKYLAAVAGAVYIGQRPLADLSSGDLARQVAVVLTDRLRTELMTCEDVVATGRYPHTGRFGVLGREDRRQVRQAMELLHAWELRDLDFRQASDGQKQRVMIARALCQEPRVIVLDEPTAYLDVRHKLELLAILRGLAKQRGITVVMSLHELDMAQKISDLILCVDGDVISHYGPPAEIFADGQIDRIFGLPHGAYDPLSGSLEFAPPAGRAEVFVIAGGGSGVPAYRALQRQGVPFATGLLHGFDIDCRIGSKLAAEVFATTGFEAIGPELFQKALDRLGACRAVVDCLTDYGPLNEFNRTLAERAAALGLPVVAAVCDLPAQVQPPK